MKAQSHPADSLVFECDFEEPPEKVWRALTEPRLLQAWLAADPFSADSADSADSAEGRTAPSELQPSPRRARDLARVAGKGCRIVSSEYEILTAEPHRFLRYRWRDRESGVADSHRREVHSVVTVELVPDVRGGTHLRLTHGEFRIISTALSMAAAGVTPITSARRRRAPILSLAPQFPSRRAA